MNGSDLEDLSLLMIQTMVKDAPLHVQRTLASRPMSLTRGGSAIDHMLTRLCFHRPRAPETQRVTGDSMEELFSLDTAVFVEEVVARILADQADDEVLRDAVRWRLRHIPSQGDDLLADMVDRRRLTRPEINRGEPTLFRREMMQHRLAESAARGFCTSLLRDFAECHPQSFEVGSRRLALHHGTSDHDVMLMIHPLFNYAAFGFEAQEDGSLYLERPDPATGLDPSHSFLAVPPVWALMIERSYRRTEVFTVGQLRRIRQFCQGLGLPDWEQGDMLGWKGIFYRLIGVVLTIEAARLAPAEHHLDHSAALVLLDLPIETTQAALLWDLGQALKTNAVGNRSGWTESDDV